MTAGLPTACWVVQRAARASAWGSSLGLQDPAGLVTCSPLSEPVIPFVLNCCSAIRWLDRSAVQRHRSSTVRWLGCSLCVLPAACCHLPAILRSLPSACWPLPRRARHPNPQHRANEILNQRIRFHGRPTCCIDREELKSPIHEFKHLAPKRCPVPFYGGLPLVPRGRAVRARLGGGAGPVPPGGVRGRDAGRAGGRSVAGRVAQVAVIANVPYMSTFAVPKSLLMNGT